MKVYVLLGGFDYEGTCVYMLGAYSSKEEAESALDVFEVGEPSFDDYEIVKCELNAPAEYVS